MKWLKDNGYKYVIKENNKVFYATKDEKITDDSNMDRYEVEDGEKLPIKKLEVKKI